MYPSFDFGVRRLLSVHPRFPKKYAHQNDPLNQGNLHELKLRLKIVGYPGIEVADSLYHVLQNMLIWKLSDKKLRHNGVFWCLTLTSIKFDPENQEI